MRSRFLLVSVAVVAVSAVAPFNIHAQAAGTVTLTPAQTRALFGDTISYTYYNGTDYVEGTATYLTSAVVYKSGNLASYPIPLNGRFIVYQNSEYLYNDSGFDYFSAQFKPAVSLSGLTMFQASFGVSISCEYRDGTLYSVDTWQPQMYPQNYVRYNLNGDTFTNGCNTHSVSQTSSIPYISFAEFEMGSGSNASGICFRMAPIAMETAVLSTIQDIRMTAQHSTSRYYGSSGPSGRTYFLVGCPTLSDSYQENQGGETGSDLTATNQKLDNIISILSLIANQSQNQVHNNSYYDSVTPADQQQQIQAQGNFDNDYSSALDQQADIDSVVNHQNLYSINMSDNSYPMDVSFNGLWNEGSGQTNPLILGMCLIPITIAVISYVLFGKKI